jgi:hypothetical protein
VALALSRPVEEPLVGRRAAWTAPDPTLRT